MRLLSLSLSLSLSPPPPPPRTHLNLIVFSLSLHCVCKLCIEWVTVKLNGEKKIQITEQMLSQLALKTDKYKLISTVKTFLWS